MEPNEENTEMVEDVSGTPDTPTPDEATSDTTTSDDTISDDTISNDTGEPVVEKPSRKIGVVLFAGLIAFALVASFLISFAIRGGFSSDSDNLSVIESGEQGVDAQGSAITTAPVEVLGEPLPEYDIKADTDAAVGLPFPGIIGVNFDNNPVAIPSDGKAKVVVVFAHYSPVAGQFLSSVESLAKEGKLPADVAIYGVSTKADAEKESFPPSVWLQSNNWPYLSTTIADSSNSEVFKAVGGPGVPFFIAVGPDGKVVARTVGNLSNEGFLQFVEVARTGNPNEFLERTQL